MPLLKINSKHSLTRTTLIKMGIRIAIIIIAVTLISYSHVMSNLETQVVEQLEKYITERGQRESNLFTLSEDNHAIFKQEFLSQFKQMGNEVPIERFNQIFQPLEDGTLRMPPEIFTGFRQPGTSFVVKDLTGFIGQNVTITDELRRRIIVTFDMITAFSPAWASWVDRFPNFYVTMPENIILTHFMNTAWALDAPADFKLGEEVWVAIADKKHNPTRETVWTAFYYDSVAKDWMVTCATPVDVDGEHLITIGHDILLKKLFERTLNDRLEGTYNLIFREDGRLIVHPDKIDEIREKGGEVDIPDTGDSHLINLFEQVKNIKLGQVVLENSEEYLAVTKINGPDWYFVTVYPKSLLAGLAFETASFILILGLISLLIEIIVLFFVLRKQVAQPLQEFLGATQQIAGGHFGRNVTEDLPVNRRDEIGILAQSFYGMAGELKNSFDTLEAKNAELQHLDKIKDEFLANTSHELRTPLNGIIGIAESLNDGAAGPLSDEVQKNLLMIAQSGHRLNNLVNDILDFSKLKHKNIELQLKAVGIREVSEVVLTLCQPLLGHKPVQLVINAIAPDLPPAYADENRLQQILYNLVGNAIKFTESGRIEISAKLNINKQALAITVSDTGIGIPAEQLDRIFESFEQGEGATEREYGGTGLGLAVTQQLVELHNGHIQVESTVGVGSQFSFTLPIAQVEKSEVQFSQLRPQALIETSQSLTPATDGQSKILVVDDEPVNIQVLVNHLSLQNYAVYQASNGMEALDMINKGFKPDLILLDVMMPKMTGYEVCRRLREQFSLNELPILMLTAKNQVSDMVKGLEMGANDYLTKPVSKDELLARVQTQIQLYQIHLENAELYDELHESEQRLTQILEAMPVGVNVTDASGRNYYSNKTALQIVGQSLDTSSCLEEWPTVFQAHQAGTSQLYPHERMPGVQALQGHKSRVDDIEIHQGGEIIPVEMWGTPIFDDNKQVNYAITAFADITERLKREQAERGREAAEAVNKMMTDSIQYAKIIQSSLLPNLEQVKTFLPKSFFLWMPRDIVGGDMIYAQSVENGFILAVVDCTGHGVPGAFMTMVASTQLRRIIRDEGCYEPSDILKRLNFLVKTSLQQDSAQTRSDDGLDAAICWLNPQEKTLTFAGAKLPLYYIHNDQLNVIAGDRQSLGYKRSNLDFEFTTRTVSIEPGMSFYMSSDGFLDQLGGPKRFPFGNKRFRKLLMENRHHAFDEQSPQMLRAFNEYKGEHDRQDDVTVVGFKL